MRNLKIQEHTDVRSGGFPYLRPGTGGLYQTRLDSWTNKFPGFLRRFLLNIQFQPYDLVQAPNLDPSNLILILVLNLTVDSDYNSGMHQRKAAVLRVVVNWNPLDSS